ncbi:hypothetical protein NX059_004754 [Plenodomus lindquistii]|nr:hypothetical protein NX059_004754 [Plenodomus lindquistii]
MRLAAAATTTTFLFATLACACPAPVAQPDSNDVAEPISVVARDAAIIESIQLEARAKKPKPASNSNDTNTTSAAIALTPSRILQAGALGLGVIEVVRLWG